MSSTARVTWSNGRGGCGFVDELRERLMLSGKSGLFPGVQSAIGRYFRDFGEILTDRLGSTLPTWIDAGDAGQLPGLTGFALHLLRDLDAVTAGLTPDWNSGGIEGAVSRIKRIRRQLYGRAGFELLSKMILLQ